MTTNKNCLTGEDINTKRYSLAELLNANVMISFIMQNKEKFDSDVDISDFINSLGREIYGQGVWPHMMTEMDKLEKQNVVINMPTKKGASR